jgi:hypothetical protein
MFSQTIENANWVKFNPVLINRINDVLILFGSPTNTREHMAFLGIIDISKSVLVGENDLC